jgi:hypothetical protein
MQAVRRMDSVRMMENGKQKRDPAISVNVYFGAFGISPVCTILSRYFFLFLLRSKKKRVLFYGMISDEDEEQGCGLIWMAGILNK